MDNREKESIGNYEEQFDADTMDNDTRKKKRRGKIASRILFGLYSLIIFVLMLVYESVKWGLNKWGNLSIEEMIYTLKAPLKGTGQNMVGEYLQKALLPAVLISLGLIIVCALVRRFKKKYITFPFLCLVLAFAVFLGGIKGGYYFWNKLDVGAYMYNQMHPSTFIEKNYVNPAKTKLTFPQKKRNVIYLFLESMEQTYMDSSVGGHHAQNIIVVFICRIAVKPQKYPVGMGIVLFKARIAQLDLQSLAADGSCPDMPGIFLCDPVNGR